MKKTPSPDSRPLLMGCTLAELRAKLTTPASPLAPWYAHVLALARRDPQFFAPYTVLACLVTGDALDRQRCRETFLRYVALREEAESSADAQLHTHTVSAQLARWAIFYDWVADLGLFSPDEDAAICATLLDHAHIFSLAQLQGRIRSFDNQILSNAFGATAVGYVLGVRRGRSALAQRLFERGFVWLEDLLRRLTPSGYTGEGSTYQEQVVQPVTLLSTLLLEHVTGQPVLERGVAPDGPPVREVLEVALRTVGPAGLLPGWDAYGFQPATIKSGLVYLARITGNHEPLEVIRHSGTWYRAAHPAWELDDRLWSLIWWPADAPPGPAPRFAPWLTPSIAGALQDAANRLRLFQCWDECGDATRAGRGQVDPNAITLEAYGSPILLDGLGEIPRELLPLPEQPIVDYVGPRALETIREYCVSSWNYHPTQAALVAMAMNGSVGMSNALVLDGESWYVPLHPQQGRGEALHAVGPLQVLRGDATPFYTDRYDVQRVTRTSALLHGRYVLVSDRVRSASPHTVTWQAFVRAPAAADDGRVVIQTPEQVRCDLIPLQPGPLDTAAVEGFPKHVFGRSVRVQHAVAPAADARLDVALLPQPLVTLAQDLTPGWERTIAGTADAVSLADAYLSDPATAPESPRLFGRRFEFSPEPGRRYFVSVGTAGRSLALTLNGRAFEPVVRHPQGTWEDSSCFLAWWFDVTDALVRGENALTLTAPFFHGESVCGPVGLHVERSPHAADVRRLGPDSFEVRFGDLHDLVLLDHEGGLTPWAGGQTDARHAVRATDGAVAAAEVRRLELPGLFTFGSTQPCDLAWSAGRLTLSRVPAGTEADVAFPDAKLRLTVSAGRRVAVEGDAAAQGRLEVQVEDPPAAQPPPPVALVAPPLPPLPTVALTEPNSAEAVYALAAAHGTRASRELIAALGSGNWRTQMAAADVAGRLGLNEAVPVLLDLFAQGEAELPYPPITKWWTWSKMLHGKHPEGPDPDLPRPVGVKRWRVKLGVVLALGRLGDGRAVAPLEAAMARCNDFFPVLSQLAVALGRLGSPTSIPVLERHANHMEINLRTHARLSLSLLRGELDRATYESRVGFG
jgi:hypothetical protein